MSTAIFEIQLRGWETMIEFCQFHQLFAIVFLPLNKTQKEKKPHI